MANGELFCGYLLDRNLRDEELKRRELSGTLEFGANALTLTCTDSAICRRPLHPLYHKIEAVGVSCHLLSYHSIHFAVHDGRLVTWVGLREEVRFRLLRPCDEQWIVAKYEVIREEESDGNQRPIFSRITEAQLKLRLGERIYTQYERLLVAMDKPAMPRFWMCNRQLAFYSPDIINRSSGGRFWQQCAFAQAQERILELICRYIQKRIFEYCNVMRGKIQQFTNNKNFDLNKGDILALIDQYEQCKYL